MNYKATSLQGSSSSRIQSKLHYSSLYHISIAYIKKSLTDFFTMNGWNPLIVSPPLPARLGKPARLHPACL